MPSQGKDLKNQGGVYLEQQEAIHAIAARPSGGSGVLASGRRGLALGCGTCFDPRLSDVCSGDARVQGIFVAAV